MSDTDPYVWHLAPVSDAFGPPSPIVNPEHVGYVIQRYQRESKLGLVIPRHWRLETAEELCALLNTNPTHPRVSGLRPVERYL